MRGTLIVNAFWDSPSMAEMARQLQAAARALGMALQIRTNADFPCLLPGPRPLFPADAGDFALFWDKDVRLARLLEIPALVQKTRLQFQREKSAYHSRRGKRAH